MTNRKIILFTICILFTIPILFVVFDEKVKPVIPDFPEKQSEGNVAEKIEKAARLAVAQPNENNYIELSLLYINNQQYLQGIEACKSALLINPASVVTLNNLGFSFLMLKKYKEAETYLNAALKVKPEYELAKNNLDMLLVLKGKEIALLAELKEQCKAAPTYSNFFGLGQKYYGLGMLREALNAYKEAEKLEPDKAEVHNNLCAIYNDLQKWENAIVQCERALAIKPDYELAKSNLVVAKNR